MVSRLGNRGTGDTGEMVHRHIVAAAVVVIISNIPTAVLDTCLRARLVLALVTSAHLEPQHPSAVTLCPARRLLLCPV